MSKLRTCSPPLSEAEGFGHIKSYLQSGLRSSEYYKRHNLSEWQFYSWRKRYFAAHPEEKPSPDQPSDSQLRPVRLSASPCCSFSGMEIHYPHGVKVVVGTDHPLSIEQLSQLIQLPL